MMGHWRHDTATHERISAYERDYEELRLSQVALGRGLRIDNLRPSAVFFCFGFKFGLFLIVVLVNKCITALIVLSRSSNKVTR
jgi:hypothetical protein